MNINRRTLLQLIGGIGPATMIAKAAVEEQKAERKINFTHEVVPKALDPWEVVKGAHVLLTQKLDGLGVEIAERLYDVTASVIPSGYIRRSTLGTIINKRAGALMELEDGDMSLSPEAFIKKFMVPAVNYIANEMAYHRTPLAVIRLERPGGMEWSEEVSSPNHGASVRLVRAYGAYDQGLGRRRNLCRLDVCYGIAGQSDTSPFQQRQCYISSKKLSEIIEYQSWYEPNKLIASTGH